MIKNEQTKYYNILNNIQMFFNFFQKNMSADLYVIAEISLEGFHPSNRTEYNDFWSLLKWWENGNKKKKKESSTEGRNCGEYTRNFWNILRFKNMHMWIVNCFIIVLGPASKSLSEMPGGPGPHFFLDQTLTVKQTQQKGPHECFIDMVATQCRALVP